MFFINYDLNAFFGAMTKAAGMSPLTVIRDNADEFEKKLFSNIINEKAKEVEKDDEHSFDSLI